MVDLANAAAAADRIGSSRSVRLRKAESFRRRASRREFAVPRRCRIQYCRLSRPERRVHRLAGSSTVQTEVLASRSAATTTPRAPDRPGLALLSVTALWGNEQTCC